MATRKNTGKSPAQPNDAAQKAAQAAQAVEQAGTAAAPAIPQLGGDAGPNSNDTNVGSATAGTNSGASTIEAAAPAAAAAPDQVECIIVRSLPMTLRRAGFRFSREPLGIALSVLPPEQLKALEDDPDLVVERATFDRDVVGIE